MGWVAENRSWFDPYVRKIADLVGLRDWLIDLDDALPGEGALAECEPTYGRRHAVMRFAPEVNPAELRNTVVHECIHCHFALIDWNRNSIQGVVGTPVWITWDGAYSDAKELAIDAIATAWAASLPLPEPPGGA